MSKIIFKKISTLILTLLIFVSIAKYYLAFSAPLGKEYFKGIDVSAWNENIDYKKLKESGQAQFIIIRTSYGWSNWKKFTDSQLQNNIKGAKSAGIPIGAYHYSYATNTKQAKKEATFFLEKLKGTQWEYPVFIDFEDECQSKLSKKERTDIVETFLDIVEKAGYYVGYYTNLKGLRNLDLNRLARFDLWVAQWNKTCSCEKSYGIWQHTSAGSIPGIRGRVDLNISYVNYPKIIKERHLNGFKKN